MNFNERFDRFARIYLEEDRLLTDAESEELVKLTKEVVEKTDLTTFPACILGLQNADPADCDAMLVDFPLIRFWRKAMSRGGSRIDQVKQVYKLVVKDVNWHFFSSPMSKAEIT